MRPTFSVIIPTRNRLAPLLRALVSLDRQSFRDFEVIIVDDGSDEDIASASPQFPDLALRVLRSEPRGGNHARNLGTDAALGRFIAYLDSDDVFLAEKLELFARKLDKAEADILVSPLYVWRGAPVVPVRPSRRPAPGEDISEFYFVADQRICNRAVSPCAENSPSKCGGTNGSKRCRTPIS
jgi:glycosyltransferase involved in cell wall biosynthesis